MTLLQGSFWTGVRWGWSLWPRTARQLRNWPRAMTLIGRSVRAQQRYMRGLTLGAEFAILSLRAEWDEELSELGFTPDLVAPILARIPRPPLPPPPPAPPPEPPPPPTPESYAIDDFRWSLSNLSEPYACGNAALRYVCAIVAESTYYHVPESEFDPRRRATLVPSEAYRAIIASGTSSRIDTLFSRLEIPTDDWQVTETENSIAVAFRVGRFLFIGMRGTRFVFDWIINCHAWPASAMRSVAEAGQMCFSRSRVHRGFAREAVRISSSIVEWVRQRPSLKFDHVFLTGHSLGGAVAAISERIIGAGLGCPTSVVLFGSPRYGDSGSYGRLASSFPIYVRRSGDMVPVVPPRIMGYADYPNTCTPAGRDFPENTPFDWAGLMAWPRFLLTGFNAHLIEEYRSEIGEGCGRGKVAKLFEHPKLARRHLGSPRD